MMTSPVPTGARAIGVLLLIGTVAIGLSLAGLTFPGGPLDALVDEKARTAQHAHPMGFPVLLVTIAVIVAGAGAGLVRGRRWGWALAIALFAINATVDAVVLVGKAPGQAITGVLIAAALIAYLTSRRVRSAYR